MGHICIYYIILYYMIHVYITQQLNKVSTNQSLMLREVKTDFFLDCLFPFGNLLTSIRCAALLPSLDVVAVCQAPSPESNLNSPFSIH